MPNLQIYQFNDLQPYPELYHRMRDYTLERHNDSADRIWLLEHFPVYTQGQAGKPEHILQKNNIPIIQSDRGGQVTYHGPGQLIVYTLVDLKRMNLGIHDWVQNLHNIIIKLLNDYDVDAHCISGAPGVYVQNQKIASIGLRVRKGCTYHGFSLNVDMDLNPFLAIHPCGYKNLVMTSLHLWRPTITVNDLKTKLQPLLLSLFHSTESLHEQAV